MNALHLPVDMPDEDSDSPILLSFEEATDHYLTEPVWYVGTSEGVLAPYSGNAAAAAALADPSNRSLFEA